MFAKFSPERENTAGARWNPKEVPAIYASLSRDGVLAEADHQIAQEPLRPKVRRTIYAVRVDLSKVLDITSDEVLNAVGLSVEALSEMDHAECQHVGGAAEYLGHDGLLVPNVRLHGSTNLVIYPNQQDAAYRFRIVDAEVIFDPEDK
jgi:RES domain-containing protein